MSQLRVVQIGTKHDHAADATLTLKQLSEDFVLLGVVEENDEYRKIAMENEDYKKRW